MNPEKVKNKIRKLWNDTIGSNKLNQVDYSASKTTKENINKRNSYYQSEWNSLINYNH
jgi:hypothetical protein